MTATRDERTRFLTDAGEPSAFIIVTSARSGSNLLVTYLRQASRLACFGEILRERFPETPGWDKLVRRLDLPAAARRLHAEAPTEFWELCLAHGLRRRRYLGAKTFYYHRRDDRLLWDRFGEPDHRVLHLWRDATFDQYVSRLLALASGEWKAGDGAVEPRVTFERDEYMRYREAMRRDVEWARTRYGDTDRYVELEYGQLADHAFVEGLLLRLFGEHVDVREGLRRQRSRPKIEYLTNPADAEPFAADSLSAGYAPG
jgi:hypothetical protein